DVGRIRELHRDAAAAAGRLRGDVGPAGDAGGRLLDDAGDLLVHRVRRRAGIGGRDGDHRLVDVRQFADLDAAIGREAGDDDQQVHHDGHDRAAHGERRDAAGNRTGLRHRIMRHVVLMRLAGAMRIGRIGTVDAHHQLPFAALAGVSPELAALPSSAAVLVWPVLSSVTLAPSRSRCRPSTTTLSPFASPSPETRTWPLWRSSTVTGTRLAT